MMRYSLPYLVSSFDIATKLISSIINKNYPKLPQVKKKKIWYSEILIEFVTFDKTILSIFLPEKHIRTNDKILKVLMN